ncbi:MAG: PorT family protein [Flavobacteriales bacterium]|nr:PorT family protein [Flavobacteriales bacterium]
MNIRFIFILPLLIQGFFVSAQSEEGFKAGLKAGLNTSQMTGDGYAGFYKFSPVFGAFASHGFGEHMRFQYELLYQNKGSRDPARPDEGKYTSYKIVMNYIEVPVLWQYNLKKFTLELGPGFSFLLHTKELDENGVVKVSTYPWRSFELDGMLGVNYNVNEHLFLNIRSHHSISSVVSSTVVNRYGVYGGAWNIVIAFTANYRF